MSASNFFDKMQDLNKHLSDTLKWSVNKIMREYVYGYDYDIKTDNQVIEFFKLKESCQFVFKMRKILNRSKFSDKERYIAKIEELYGIKLHNLRSYKYYKYLVDNE